MLKKFLKKTLIAIVIAATLASLTLSTIAVQPDLADSRFTDVHVVDWFYNYVNTAVELGLFRGRSESVFEPAGLLTLGETITLAARLHSIYHNGIADFEPSTPFYAVYLDYALEHGIVGHLSNFNAPVTRERFATILYRSLPASALSPINDIPAFGVTDVDYGCRNGALVYALYRAGILTGSDRFGTFGGSQNISRAEASTILLRLAQPEYRVLFGLPTNIPATEIFARTSSAVFMIETFDDRGVLIRSGSGFFISPEGRFVTALHVIDGARSATIRTLDNTIYQVAGLLAYDRAQNVALLQADGNDFPFLILADSDNITVGSTIYAVGSPLDLINTMSEGIIAYTSREMDLDPMIQFTAPISFGSGGGPVLNSLGQVIGIASSSFTAGQNLNLAIPINLIRSLTPSRLQTLEAHFQSWFE